jgi:CheY-like chemotaxis protein
MSKKLLLADDSITIQKVIQITFAHEDYELSITDNGDAALAKAREIKPDLVMADVYMPGKNGYELATAIKQDPALQHVPVLLLAGSFEPFDEEKAISCKADAWIEKPFESQNLIDKVAELLDAAQAAPQPQVPEPVTAEVADVAFDEFALAEPLAAEPAMTTEQEDPFADISFEEETPATEPEPVAAADDWSDVLSEPPAEQVVEEANAVAEGAAPEVADDFGFVEEQPAAADAITPKAETTAVDTDFDAFDMDGEEILPLDDEDILGAEDLEPVMEEQTLTPWSRAETEDDDFFAGPAEEEITFEESLTEEPQAPVFFEESPSSADEAAFVEEASDFVFEEPALVEEASEFTVEEPALVEETNDFVFEEPVLVEEASEFTVEEPAFVAEPEPAEEPAAFIAPEPAAITAAAVDVEAKTAAMSESEIEEIIERVVTKVVEKLAGSILEKVAWEVVPDLAENLIREEIRKIKDAAA